MPSAIDSGRKFSPSARGKRDIPPTAGDPGKLTSTDAIQPAPRAPRWPPGGGRYRRGSRATTSKPAPSAKPCCEKWSSSSTGWRRWSNSRTGRPSSMRRHASAGVTSGGNWRHAVTASAWTSSTRLAGSASAVYARVAHLRSGNIAPDNELRPRFVRPSLPDTFQPPGELCGHDSAPARGGLLNSETSSRLSSPESKRYSSVSHSGATAREGGSVPL